MTDQPETQTPDQRELSSLTRRISVNESYDFGILDLELLTRLIWRPDGEAKESTITLLADSSIHETTGQFPPQLTHLIQSLLYGLARYIRDHHGQHHHTHAVLLAAKAWLRLSTLLHIHQNVDVLKQLTRTIGAEDLTFFVPECLEHKLFEETLLTVKYQRAALLPMEGIDDLVSSMLEYFDHTFQNRDSVRTQASWPARLNSFAIATFLIDSGLFEVTVQMINKRADLKLRQLVQNNLVETVRRLGPYMVNTSLSREIGRRLTIIDVMNEANVSPVEKVANDDELRGS